MLSRKSILLLSIGLTLALYAAMLWIAPWVTLLESDRLAPRISTRFRVEFLDAPLETGARATGRQPEGLRPAEISTVFGEDPGTLQVEDTLAAPPVETPQLTERMASESPDRSYDLAPESERIRNVDARILEIAQETARQDINIARRLIQPGIHPARGSAARTAQPRYRTRGHCPGTGPAWPRTAGGGIDAARSRGQRRQRGRAAL